MPKKQLLKIIIFNVSLVLLNIVCFSDRLLNFSISYGNNLIVALSLTIIIMSVVSFFYVNYKLLTEDTNSNSVESVEEIAELIKMLNSNRDKHSIEPAINQTIEQINSMIRKQKTLDNLLILKFKVIDKDLNGFKDVIDDTNNLMFRNVKKIISIITIFDQEEYSSYMRKAMSPEKKAIYNENERNLNELLSKNEEIIINIDKLLIEISKIGDTDEKDEINLQRIGDIISNMKKLRTSENE